MSNTLAYNPYAVQPTREPFVAKSYLKAVGIVLNFMSNYPDAIVKINREESRKWEPKGHLTISLFDVCMTGDKAGYCRGHVVQFYRSEHSPEIMPGTEYISLDFTIDPTNSTPWGCLSRANTYGVDLKLDDAVPEELRHKLTLKVEDHDETHQLYYWAMRELVNDIGDAATVVTPSTCAGSRRNDLFNQTVSTKMEEITRSVIDLHCERLWDAYDAKFTYVYSRVDANGLNHSLDDELNHLINGLNATC